MAEHRRRQPTVVACHLVGLAAGKDVAVLAHIQPDKAFLVDVVAVARAQAGAVAGLQPVRNIPVLHCRVGRTGDQLAAAHKAHIADRLLVARNRQQRRAGVADVIQVGSVVGTPDSEQVGVGRAELHAVRRGAQPQGHRRAGLAHAPQPHGRVVAAAEDELGVQHAEVRGPHALPMLREGSDALALAGVPQRDGAPVVAAYQVVAQVTVPGDAAQLVVGLKLHQWVVRCRAAGGTVALPVGALMPQQRRHLVQLDLVCRGAGGRKHVVLAAKRHAADHVAALADM
mmetsp:Transcript_13635/g.34401  ORF Transcript_13635/g.34401 Transcript_13635/m.34401 type:complete len:285 (-) Transcript_13635:2058-2912(-)